MSSRDKDILKSAGVTQKLVADLFGITLQGVNRGVSASSHYLTAERLGKLVVLLESQDVEKANKLRSSLNEMVLNGEQTSDKVATGYVQLNALSDILQRVQEDVIWIPIDALTRLIQEVDCIRDYIENVEKRLTIIISEPVEDLRAVFDERIYRFDFNTIFKSEIVVIHCETANFTPEMLISNKATFVKTVYGFQNIRESESNVVLNRFFKQSKISPNHLPMTLGEGYTKALQYSQLPTVRILTQFLFEMSDISTTLTNYLKKTILNTEQKNAAPVENVWTELHKLATDIEAICSKSDAEFFNTGIEYLKLKYG